MSVKKLKLNVKTVEVEKYECKYLSTFVLVLDYSLVSKMCNDIVDNLKKDLSKISFSGENIDEITLKQYNTILEDFHSLYYEQIIPELFRYFPIKKARCYVCKTRKCIRYVLKNIPLELKTDYNNSLPDDIYDEIGLIKDWLYDGIIEDTLCANDACLNIYILTKENEEEDI